MNDVDVTRRLERLEAENRRLKRIGAASVLVVGAIILMGQATPKKGPPVAIEAQAFVLVDGLGTERGRLAVTKGGEVLTLRGRAGSALVLETTATSTSMEMMGATTKDVTSLAVSETGSSLDMGRASGVVVLLNAGPSGTALLMSKKNDEASVTLSAVEAGTGLVVTRDGEKAALVMSKGRLINTRP